MNNRADLRGIKHSSALQVKHRRRAWLLLLLDEYSGFGNVKMNTGSSHRTNALHRTSQLTLQRTLVIDLLGKLGNTEPLVFHQFKTDISPLGESLRSQLEACFIDLLGRHQ